MATVCGMPMPPNSSSMAAASSPDSANTPSASETSSTVCTRSPSNQGSSWSFFLLCGAKCRVAIRSLSSRASSKVSRECSA